MPHCVFLLVGLMMFLLEILGKKHSNVIWDLSGGWNFKILIKKCGIYKCEAIRKSDCSLGHQVQILFLDSYVKGKNEAQIG